MRSATSAGGISVAPSRCASSHSCGSRVSTRTTASPSISVRARWGSISSIRCLTLSSGSVAVAIRSNLLNPDPDYFKKYSDPRPDRTGEDVVSRWRRLLETGPHLAEPADALLDRRVRREHPRDAAARERL